MVTGDSCKPASATPLNTWSTRLDSAQSEHVEAAQLGAITWCTNLIATNLIANRSTSGAFPLKIDLAMLSFERSHEPFDLVKPTVPHHTSLRVSQHNMTQETQYALQN